MPLCRPWQQIKLVVGYVSLSSVNNTIKALSFEGVEANEANVLNDTYKLKRPFVMMRRVDGDYVNDTEYQLTLAFIAYVASNDGADVIANAGATATSGTGTWASQVANFPVCALDNSAVTLKFGGSDSVQKSQKLCRQHSRQLAEMLKPKTIIPVLVTVTNVYKVAKRTE
jgi:hypothetical protein